MKEIRAIVRPSRLERLRTALRAIPNFPGVTIFKAEGFTAPAAVDKRSVKDELTDFSDKLMVCVLADDSMVETIREAIVRPATRGRSGMASSGPWTSPRCTASGMVAAWREIA